MWCGTFVLMGAFVAALASFGSGGIEKAGAKPIDARIPTTSVSVASVSVGQAAFVDAPMGDVPVAKVSVDKAPLDKAALDRAPVTESAANAPATKTEPKTFVVASADPSQIIQPEAPSMQAALPNPLDPTPNEVKANAARAAVKPLEIPEDCIAADICIDQYLWALYQRTPKQDTNKVIERRKVVIKRKGKSRTVTRSFTKLVDADFTWKDPKAAIKLDMTVRQYVFGGMDRSFKRRLLYMLIAADKAGLAPGITSGFRDDFRQAIATGQKAASNMSYHGGSTRGGYGHGLAADIVSVKGATRGQRWVSSDNLWKWVDENGKQYGIGRPYLDRDPPHVAPIDGREYIAHYRPPTIQQLAAIEKKKQDDKNKVAALAQRTIALKMVSADVINARRDQ
jgi:hypothetical protein